MTPNFWGPGSCYLTSLIGVLLDQKTLLLTQFACFGSDFLGSCWQNRVPLLNLNLRDRVSLCAARRHRYCHQRLTNKVAGGGLGGGQLLRSLSCNTSGRAQVMDRKGGSPTCVFLRSPLAFCGFNFRSFLRQSRSRDRTGENRTGEPRPLEWTLSWALPWAPSWHVSWELSWGVLQGLKTR